MDSSNAKDGIFIGNPTIDEIKNFFLREKRLADIRHLERNPSPDKDSSPELSESFEIYLKQRKKKVEDEKLKLATASNKPVDKEEEEEEIHEIMDSPPQSPQKPVVLPIRGEESPETIVIDDAHSEDSFLELEKMCENTLTLNNVSELLTDLTSLDTSDLPEEIRKKLSMNLMENLHDVEAPSFLSNMTLFSPKNSPFRKTAYEKRPSTIMEVTELSTTTKSGSSSYQTAEEATSTLYEKSECYQTANEESWTSGSVFPKKRAFFDDSMNYTKDSLDSTQRATIPNITQMTQDSLNDKSEDGKSFESEDGNLSLDMSVNCMNDTLEAIERILAQGPAPSTPKNVVTPKQPSKPSPTPWSAAKSVLKPLSARGTPINSPLMKFSPSTKTSPMSNFKLPKQPLSSSKTPQFSAHNKKFQHIVSPIARYINNTPELPLTAHAQNQIGIGSTRTHFNFRDSDAFAKENKSMPNSGSSLPMRAKTKTSNMVLNSGDKKVHGGEKFQKLLVNSNTRVGVHVKESVNVPSQLFHDNTFANETLLSNVSFPASHLSVDDSILIVEEVKRFK